MSISLQPGQNVCNHLSMLTANTSSLSFPPRALEIQPQKMAQNWQPYKRGMTVLRRRQITKNLPTNISVKWFVSLFSFILHSPLH